MSAHISCTSASIGRSYEHANRQTLFTISAGISPHVSYTKPLFHTTRRISASSCHSDFCQQQNTTETTVDLDKMRHIAAIQ